IPFDFLGGTIAIWGIGFADDIWRMEPRRKLIVEVAALAFGVLTIDASLIGKVIAIACGLVLVNTFAVLDGLDGLAGGTAFFVLLPIAVTSSEVAVVAALVAGWAAAFLVFNVSPARIFLGNQGSLL